MNKFDIKITNAKDEHIDKLAKLWNENFGDNIEYIDFFMKNKFPSCKVIIALNNNIVVGSQYLMPVTASEYSSIKKGYYLYALSVDSNYRNCGIGKMLVDHACKIAKEENAFIILCPASKELVNYYRKLGFVENSYVSQLKFHSQNVTDALITELSVNDFEMMRNNFFDNLIVWDKKSLDYILKENKFAGGINLRIEYKGSHYVIGRKNSENFVVLESNVPKEKMKEFTSILCKSFEFEEIVWTTPFDSDESNPILYGMTYNLPKNNYYFNLILN